MKIVPIAGSSKVEDVISDYLETHALRKGIERTERFNLRAPREAFGARRPRDITQEAVDRYAQARRKGRYGKRAVSDSTIRREVVALQAALNHASRRGLVPGKPVFAFSKPSEGDGRVLWMDEGQEREFLSAVATESVTLRLMARLGLTYGVRRGAMMDLRFGPQIDWRTETIDFNPPGRRRMRKGRAVVPMTPEVRTDLQVALQQRGEDAFVLERDALRQFAAFTASIGMNWVTPHVLKHTAVSLMLRGGADEKVVARITATDPATIRRTYRHHSADELLDAVGKRRG